MPFLPITSRNKGNNAKFPHQTTQTVDHCLSTSLTHLLNQAKIQHGVKTQHLPSALTPGFDYGV